MERHDAAALAFKLAGIYVMVEAIKLVPTVAIPLRSVLKTSDVSWRDILAVGVPLLVACTALSALAWFLIARSRRFAERSLSEPQQDRIDFRRRPDELQVIAFSVVGVLLLTSGVPDLVNRIAAAFYHREDLWEHLRETAPDLLVLFMQLSAGYWLFFGPRSATRVWMRLSGTAPSVEPPGPGPA